MAMMSGMVGYSNLSENQVLQWINQLPPYRLRVFNNRYNQILNQMYKYQNKPYRQTAYYDQEEPGYQQEGPGYQQEGSGYSREGM
jgi:hypothetical protein